MTLWRNLVVALVAAFALAACSSSDNGGGTDTGMMAPTPQETCEAAGDVWADGNCVSAAQHAVNTALAAIAAAETAEAAQEAYDAVKDDVTATQGETLQAAVNARIDVLTQTMALKDAAGMIDTSDLSTQDLVDAARTAIAGLRQAIADAVDIDDTSMYQTMLNNAVDAVDMAQGGIDTATRRTNQMTALSDASDDLQAALAALSGSTPTQAQLDAANNALTALNTAIADGADLTDTEKAPYQREAKNAAAPINTAQVARDKADEDAQKVADAIMHADSKSLLAAFNRAAAVTAPAISSVSASSRGEFEVTFDSTVTPAIGDFMPDAAPDMVAGHHGAMLTHDDETMVVYSNIERADAKLVDEVYEETGDPGSNEYSVTADGASDSIPISALMVADEFVVTRDTDADMATFPGSVNGAMGTFSCTISTGGGCPDPTSADGEVSALGAGTWIFTPNAGARTDVQDTDYLFFGWWLKKAGDLIRDWQVDMFAGRKGYGADGADADARTQTDLAGTLTGSATYEGAAAGKFTTVTADAGEAGHFVADAMLTVNFDADLSSANPGDDDAGVTISGMIDEFVANGTSRDCEVALTWDHDGTANLVQTVGSSLDGIGAALGDATNRSTATWTSDDVEMGTGDWNAVFYGSEDGTTHPTAATGEFNAIAGGSDIGNHIAGAFGVEKE